MPIEMVTPGDPYFSGFVDIVTIDAETSGMHNSMPAYFKDERFNLTIYIHLNESWIDFYGQTHLMVNVTIPNENHVEGETCQGTLIGGMDFDCTTSTERIYDYYFLVEPHYVIPYITEIADNIHVDYGYPRFLPLDHGSVSIDFGNVSLLPWMTTTMGPDAFYTSGSLFTWSWIELLKN